MKMLKRFIFSILIISLLMLSACSRPKEEPKEVKNLVADFKLEGIYGESIVLSNVLKDKKAILVFWATWCPYCQIELMRVEKFYAENRDKIEVIAVDIGEARTKVENFVRKSKISYPVALDFDARVAQLYQVVGVPTIVALNKEGKITYYGHSIVELAEQASF